MLLHDARIPVPLALFVIGSEGPNNQKASRIRDELLGLGRIASYLAEGEIKGAPTVSASRIKAIRTDTR